MERPVSINVIGAGRWGPNVVRSFQSLPGVSVRRVADLDAGALDRLRRRQHHVAVTTDIEAALTDPEVDAVAIATPVSTHESLGLTALEAGKDVLIEKPLAPSSQACLRLIEAAHRRNRILMVGHIFLFNAAIRHVREMVATGHLGRVVSLHASRTNLGPVRDDVNALWDLGTHDISIFNYLLGSEPEAVSAVGLRHLSDRIEDTVIASYRYPGNVLASIHASWLHPKKVRELSVVGEHRMALWDDMNLNEPVRVYDKGVERQAQAAGDTFGSFRLQLRVGDITIPTIHGGEPLATECAHFVDCVRHRRRPLADGRSGLAVVLALEAADRSLVSEGRCVAVEPSPLS